MLGAVLCDPHVTPQPATRSAPDAWGEEMLAIIPALRRFAGALTHGGADVEDLVQETLSKALGARDKFELGTNLRAWMFTILRNTYYSSRTRRRHDVEDEDGSMAASLAVGPDQGWNLEVQALRRALLSMPAAQRQALILVAAGGWSYIEAAEACDCSVGTMKSRVSRARADLETMLDGKPGWGADRNWSALMSRSPHLQ